MITDEEATEAISWDGTFLEALVMQLHQQLKKF